MKWFEKEYLLDHAGIDAVSEEMKWPVDAN